MVSDTSLAALHRLVVESDPADWIYNDEIGLYIYKPDALMQIRPVREREAFEEDWVENYSDKKAFDDKHQLTYFGCFIEEYFLVSVDGHRVSIPLPAAADDLCITRDQYRIGQIIHIAHAGFDLDNYMRRAGIVIIDNL